MTADDASRRQFLIGAASLAGGMITVLPVTDACATPETLQAAIKKVVGSAALRKGKVTLRLQNRTVEYQALTPHGALPTGSPVVVTAVLGPDTVEVAAADPLASR